MAKSNNFDCNCNLEMGMGVAVGEGGEMQLFNRQHISIGKLLAKGGVTTIPVGITGEKDREQR